MAVDRDRIYELEKEEITDYVTIMDAFSDADDAAEWAQVQVWLNDRAGELGCAAAVRTLIAGIKKKAKEMGGGTQTNESTFIFEENGVSREFNCGSWSVSENGVSQFIAQVYVTACYNPIIPIKRLVNIETGEEKVELAFFRDSHWKKIILDRAIIATAKDIVKPLAAQGVGVTSENARHLVRFIAEFEALNDLDKGSSTSKMGWCKDRFIPYDCEISFDAALDFRGLQDSIKPTGERDEWLETIRKVRGMGRYEPDICMAASFASVLLGHLGVLPSVVNLWGDTSGGKTVIMMLACSIWANPAESKYITDSNSTINAYEARLDALNDLPLLIDDFSKVSSKMEEQEFTNLIYMFCGGQGKARSNVKNTINKMKTWNCMTISNMERPLASDTMKGGAINRVLDFEMDEGKVFDAKTGSATVKSIKRNYGWAGRDFVDLVFEFGWKKIAEIRDDFYDQIVKESERQGSVKEDKQMSPLAVILTADKLAVDYIYKDGRYLDLAKCVSMLKDFGQISEGQRGYEFIIAFHLENYTAFHVDEMEADKVYTGKEFGFVENGYLYIVSNVFKRICADGNFSDKAFCQWAKRNGLLLYGNDDKCARNTLTKRHGAYIGRFYAVKLPEEDLSVTGGNVTENRQ